MDTKSLLERDISTPFITRAMVDADWNVQAPLREALDGNVVLRRQKNARVEERI